MFVWICIHMCHPEKVHGAIESKGQPSVSVAFYSPGESGYASLWSARVRPIIESVSDN